MKPPRPPYYGPKARWWRWLRCNALMVLTLGFIDWHHYIHLDSGPRCDEEHAEVCTRCWRVTDHRRLTFPCLCNPVRGSSPMMGISMPHQRVASIYGFLRRPDGD